MSLENADLRIKQVQEEKLEDEYDITDLASAIGVYTPAPTQQRETATEAELNEALQNALNNMDNEKNKPKSLSETLDTLEKEVEEQLKSKKQVKVKNSKDTPSATLDEPGNKKDDEYLMFMKADSRKNLRELHIDTKTSRNRGLNILKEMCLELETVAFAKEPVDFECSVPPMVLTVQHWNDLLRQDCDEDVQLNFRQRPVQFDEDVCRYDTDIRELLNEVQHVFAFYKDDSHFFEEDGFWLEEDEEPQLLGTLALDMVRRIREVLPEPVDKTYGFDIKNLYSEESMNALTTMISNMSTEERKFVYAAVKSFTEDYKRMYANKQGEESWVLYCAQGFIGKFLKREVSLNVDESAINLIMLNQIIVSIISKQLFNKSMEEIMTGVKKRDKDNRQKEQQTV